MKTTILKFVALSLIVPGSFASCENKEEKYNESVEIPVAEYSLVGTDCDWVFIYPTDLYPHDSFFVINSQTELTDRISCNTDNIPVVDFDKYSMLVFICDYGAKITHRLLQESEYGYKWNVHVEETSAGQRNELAVLIPKLSQEAQVSINVNREDYEPN